MKRRFGFVANSSSSSFLVVFAQVLNLSAARNWLKSRRMDPSKYIKTYNDLEMWAEWDLNYDWGGGPTISNKLKGLDKRRKYFIYELCPNEGDYAFERDGWGMINYEISLDYFNIEAQEIYNQDLNKKGMSLICKKYGAGRNG